MMHLEKQHVAGDVKHENENEIEKNVYQVDENSLLNLIQITVLLFIYL
jgi:hypothetical protein